MTKFIDLTGKKFGRLEILRRVENNKRGKAPSSKHSLDRVNNDGNYEPENTRWTTAKEQMANRHVKRIEDFSHEDLLEEVRRRGLVLE